MKNKTSYIERRGETNPKEPEEVNPLGSSFISSRGKVALVSRDFHLIFFRACPTFGQLFSAFLPRVEIFIFKAKSLNSVGDLLIM